jgi:hypothetical protein
MLRYDSYRPTDKERDFVGNLINFEPNDISYKFFNDCNVDLINSTIIQKVKKITFERYNKRIKIDPQQKHLLITIMRHIYLKNVKNQQEADIEVDILNRLVLKHTIPIIINGLLSQLRYINDYNTLRPLDLPEPTNHRNDGIFEKFSTFNY